MSTVKPDPFVLRAVAAKHRLDARTLARALSEGVERIRGADAQERTRAALADLQLQSAAA